MLKSNHAQSFIRQLEDEGFEGLMRLFQTKGLFDGDPTVNQNLLHNLTQLQGYRKGADGKYDLNNPTLTF